MRRDDEFDVFGRNVAAKLRKLAVQHRIYAEKKINDALFDAEMATYHDQAVAAQHRPTGQQQLSSNTCAQSEDQAGVSNLTNFYSNYNPNYNLNYNPNYNPNYDSNFNPNYTNNQQPH